MEKQVVSTTAAPAAIGPYSQAMVVGGLVFASGQLPLDPATGVLVGRTVTEQTIQALENLNAVLTAAGSSLKEVVKTTVYLTTMANFSSVNAVYQRYFTSDTLPARSAVAVAGLPKGSLVEIEAIAVVG